MDEQKDDKKLYELSYLISDRLSEDEVVSFLSKIKEVFFSEGAEIIKESAPKKMKLEYSINKRDYAFFGYFHFQILPEKIDKIKDSIRYEENLIRYLIIKPGRADEEKLGERLTEDGIEIMKRRGTKNKDGRKNIKSEYEEKKPVDDIALEEKLEEVEKIS